MGEPRQHLFRIGILLEGSFRIMLRRYISGPVGDTVSYVLPVSQDLGQLHHLKLGGRPSVRIPIPSEPQTLHDI